MTFKTLTYRNDYNHSQVAKLLPQLFHRRINLLREKKQKQNIGIDLRYMRFNRVGFKCVGRGKQKEEAFPGKVLISAKGRRASTPSGCSPRRSTASARPIPLSSSARLERHREMSACLSVSHLRGDNAPFFLISGLSGTFSHYFTC